MLFFLCFPAVLPLCVLNFYAEAANYTHPTTEDHRNRITPNTSIRYTVHIYTPVVLFVLFCFVSHPRSVSVRSKIPITRQNMSHKTEHVGHWEGLEMWLSVTTNSILPKAAEALRHQTQDQLDDNITSIMRQDPSQNYNHKELAKITSSLSHTLIATLKLRAFSFYNAITQPSSNMINKVNHRLIIGWSSVGHRLIIGWSRLIIGWSSVDHRLIKVNQGWSTVGHQLVIGWSSVDHRLIIGWSRLIIG